MSGEAAVAQRRSTCPGEQQELIDAIKATGKPFVVVLFNGRPLTLGDVAADVAGDPRGVVPGRRGRQRGRRRAVRQGQPRRQAAGVVPARRSARCRSTTTTSRPAGPCDATPKYNSRYRDLPTLRPAVPVRLRPELHDVRGLEPAPRARRRVSPRRAASRASVDVTNTGGAGGRRGRAALHPRPGGEHLAAGAPAARVRAGDARAGRDADGHVHARHERLRLLRQPRASSSSSRARSTSTRATAPTRTRPRRSRSARPALLGRDPAALGDERGGRPGAEPVVARAVERDDGARERRAQRRAAERDEPGVLLLAPEPLERDRGRAAAATPPRGTCAATPCRSGRRRPRSTAIPSLRPLVRERARVALDGRAGGARVRHARRGRGAATASR